MKKIGLTGSIGTGKSTVANIFRELGAYVIDADEIVHNLWKRKDIKEKVKKLLGDVFDEKGDLDRKKVANIIFKNPEKKRILENIIHPEVFKEIQRFFREVEKKDPQAVAIAEVPLMIETGSYRDYDKVIVVYAPFEVQLERLLKRGMDKEDAIRRIKSQMPIDEKVKYADIVIDNTGSIKDLKKQVIEVYKKLREDP